MKNIFSWYGDRVQKELERRAEAVAREAAWFMLQRYLVYAPVRTGYMASSAEVVKGASDSRFSYSVVVAAPYAQWVEFGHSTAAGGFVPARPSLRLALADTVAEFPAIADRARTRGLGNTSPVAAGFTK